MATDSIITAEGDIKAANEAFLAGRPIPPEVGARLDERTAEIRERIFRKHGYSNSTERIRQDRETGH